MAEIRGQYLRHTEGDLYARICSRWGEDSWPAELLLAIMSERNHLKRLSDDRESYKTLNDELFDPEALLKNSRSNPYQMLQTAYDIGYDAGLRRAGIRT